MLVLFIIIYILFMFFCFCFVARRLFGLGSKHQEKTKHGEKLKSNRGFCFCFRTRGKNDDMTSAGGIE
jgi:hypothetical protein